VLTVLLAGVTRVSGKGDQHRIINLLPHQLAQEQLSKFLLCMQSVCIVVPNLLPAVLPCAFNVCSATATMHSLLSRISPKRRLAAAACCMRMCLCRCRGAQRSCCTNITPAARYEKKPVPGYQPHLPHRKVHLHVISWDLQVGWKSNCQLPGWHAIYKQCTGSEWGSWVPPQGNELLHSFIHLPRRPAVSASYGM
jgi:hypothetical protein